MVGYNGVVKYIKGLADVFITYLRHEYLRLKYTVSFYASKQKLPRLLFYLFLYKNKALNGLERELNYITNCYI